MEYETKFRQSGNNVAVQTACTSTSFITSCRKGIGKVMGNFYHLSQSMYVVLTEGASISGIKELKMQERGSLIS